ncbi:MAG: hypothetical protein HC831_25790 [Chloroflexia bacterium]|nr:hypothetical protein [Chloroflexia bacterium]
MNLGDFGPQGDMIKKMACRCGQMRYSLMKSWDSGYSKRISFKANTLFKRANSKLADFDCEEIEFIIENNCVSKPEIDVIIGSFNNSDQVNKVVENYLAFENQLKMHFWIVETSENKNAFDKLKTSNDISKAYLLTEIEGLKKNNTRLYASNGCAISANWAFLLEWQTMPFTLIAT